MIVLIPAYEPRPCLPELVAELLAADADLGVVVVDDGSGAGFADQFARVSALGATVLHHDRNLGKGAALKTGIRHIRNEHPDQDVVTADADGQHTVRDILHLTDELRADAASGTPALVLGCRAFTGDVPWRSRVGNASSRAVFRLAAGWSLSDTQTGLRGIPSQLLAWVEEQPGDRFEFEQNVLLRSRAASVVAREVAIETVYLEGNASSHFRPIVDSLRIAVPLIRFAASSLLAFAVDTVALLVLVALTGWLIPAIVAARVISASVNFAVNRRVVFRARSEGRMRGQAVRYAVLAIALLASNIVWIEGLTAIGMPLILAKIGTEAVLFVTSYGVQRSFVFRTAELVSPAGARHSNRIASPTRMDADVISNGRNS